MPTQTTGGAENMTAQRTPVGVDEVVVTAQKRAENLQQVPLSVTALTEQQLAMRQIQAPEDLVGSVPNLQTNSPLGEGVPIFSLRGISMSDFSLAQNGPVATYFDEIYKGNFALLGVGMYDLERVEVLKGPQGTLYGRNATGGAINLITKKPEFDTEGYLTASYGNRNHWQVDGAVQAPISSKVAARLAFTVEQADGWFENVSPGKPDLSAMRQYGIRGAVRLQPNDNVDIIIRASTSLQNPWNYGVLAIPGPDGVGGPIYSLFGMEGDRREGLGRRQVDEPDVYRRHLRTKSISATADIQLSDSLTLTSISAWDQGSLLNHEDGDGTPVKTSDAEYFGRTKQLSQDLRLTSDFTGPFNFIAGVYYNRERIYNYTNINFFADVDLNADGLINASDCLDGGGFIACQVGNEFHQAKDSIGVYSDFNYALSDRLKLRLGLRYTHDDGKLKDFIAQIRDLDGVPLINTIPGDPSNVAAMTSRQFKNDNISGKIGVDYDIADDVMVYASYSRGYRGAAFSAQAFFGPAELTTVKPEILDAVEVGFKSEFLDRLLRVNGAAFWYGYKNQQFIDVDPLTTVSALVSLPKARIVGAELELQLQPADNFTISANAGLLDSKVLKGTSQGIDVRGNQLIQAPKLTLSASIDWAIPLGEWGLDVHVDASYASRQYFDILNRPTTTQGNYALLNGRIRLHPADDTYGVAIWAKNITNTFYFTNMIDASGVGFIYTHINTPRSFGISLDAKF